MCVVRDLFSTTRIFVLFIFTTNALSMLLLKMKKNFVTHLRRLHSFLHSFRSIVAQFNVSQRNKKEKDEFLLVAYTSSNCWMHCVCVCVRFVLLFLSYTNTICVRLLKQMRVLLYVVTLMNEQNLAEKATKKHTHTHTMYKQ